MGTLILIFIIVFIIWPIVKTAVRLNQARKAARDFFGGHYTPTGNPAGDRKAGWTTPPKKTKIITKDVGEYVSFQELPPDGSTQSTYYYSETTYSESQISDAEWEEIK